MKAYTGTWTREHHQLVCKCHRIHSHAVDQYQLFSRWLLFGCILFKFTWLNGWVNKKNWCKISHQVGLHLSHVLWIQLNTNIILQRYNNKVWFLSRSSRFLHVHGACWKCVFRQNIQNGWIKGKCKAEREKYSLAFTHPSGDSVRGLKPMEPREKQAKTIEPVTNLRFQFGNLIFQLKHRRTRNGF